VPPTDDPRVDLLPSITAFKGVVEAGTQTYSYVVAFDGFSVLVDVRDASLIDSLRAFPAPRHLLLSHRHIRRQEAEIERAFGLAVWLQPDDAQAPRRGPAENTPYASAYHDPLSGELAGLGFRFFRVPGHTPGHVFALLDVHGGALFTGDAVIGTTPPEAPGIELPPDWTCDDAERARRSVLGLALPPHRHILPSHGEPIVDADPRTTAAMWAGLQSQLSQRPS